MALGVYSVTSQSKRKRHNANAGKTEHVGSKSPYIKYNRKNVYWIVCQSIRLSVILSRLQTKSNNEILGDDRVTKLGL